MTRRTNNTGAFTLIELLVVISVIGLLVAVLIPSLGESRKVATLAGCGQHLHNMGLALHDFAANNNDLLPQGPAVANLAEPYGIPYMPTNQVSRDKDDYIGLGMLFTGDFQTPRAIFCPGDDDPVDVKKELANVGKAGEWVFSSYYYRHGLRTGPGTWAFGRKVSEMGFNTDGKRATSIMIDRLFEANAPPFAPRHTNHKAEAVNILFIDGHVVRQKNEMSKYAIADPPPLATDEGADRVEKIFTDADELF